MVFHSAARFPYDGTMAHVESVARALRIVAALAKTPAGLSDLARATDLPKSTVARLLNTLEKLEAVERDTSDNRIYRLGPMVQKLSSAAGGPAQLAGFARPYLEELTALTGEAAGLSIPDGYQVHYIDQTESANPVQVRDWTGEVIPMHVVSSGLAIMAHWPADQLEDFLARDLRGFTPNSVTDPAAIRRRLEAVRSSGFAWVREEFMEGINSVAAAVLDPKGPVTGALHVHGPAYRFPGSADETELGAAVAAASRRLSDALAL